MEYMEYRPALAPKYPSHLCDVQILWGQMGFKDHTKSGGRGLNFTPVSLQEMGQPADFLKASLSASLLILNQLYFNCIQLRPSLWLKISTS